MYTQDMGWSDSPSPCSWGTKYNAFSIIFWTEDRNIFLSYFSCSSWWWKKVEKTRSRRKRCLPFRFCTRFLFLFSELSIRMENFVLRFSLFPKRRGVDLKAGTKRETNNSWKHQKEDYTISVTSNFNGEWTKATSKFRNLYWVFLLSARVKLRDIYWSH